MRGTNVRNASYQCFEHPGFPGARGPHGVRIGSAGGPQGVRRGSAGGPQGVRKGYEGSWAPGPLRGRLCILYAIIPITRTGEFRRCAG
eukprot:9482552-Pyramimonas_sp.AAC.1